MKSSPSPKRKELSSDEMATVVLCATALTAAEDAEYEREFEDIDYERTLPPLETVVGEELRRACIKLTENFELGQAVADELHQQCMSFIHHAAEQFKTLAPAMREDVARSGLDVMTPQFQRDAVATVCAAFAVDSLEEGIEAAEESRPVWEAHGRHIATFPYTDPRRWACAEAEVELECGRFLRECDAVDQYFFDEFRSESIEEAIRKLLRTREPVFYRIEDAKMLSRMPVMVEGPVLRRCEVPTESPPDDRDDNLLWFGRQLRGGTVIKAAGRTREEAIANWTRLKEMLLGIRKEMLERGEIGSKARRMGSNALRPGLRRGRVAHLAGPGLTANPGAIKWPARTLDS